MLNQTFSRFTAIALFVFTIIIFHAQSAYAAAVCDNFPVTGCVVPTGFATWTINDNTTMATGQTGEPRIIPSDVTPVNSLWYRWTAPANANYILDTRNTNPSGATNFDTMIAVYTGSGSFAGLTLVAKNDDWDSTGFPNSCFGIVPRGTEGIGSSCLLFTAVAGTTYSFQVEGFGNGVGVFALNLSTLAPSAANVSVIGRVTTSDGRGVRNARVSLTDQNGNSRSVITGTFGYYRLGDVEAGQTYIMQVNSKRFQFQNNPRVIAVSEDVVGEDFIADETSFQRRE